MRNKLLLVLLAFFYVSSCNGSLAKSYPASIGDDIAMLHTALKMFKIDTGRYPTTSEGVAILVANNKAVKIPNYRKGGYVPQPPDGNWLKEYGYIFLPNSSSENYYIWNLESEERLGYSAGSWLKPPK